MSGTSHGYTGQRYDSETGLYYCKMRHFSPKLGRFLQADPIGINECQLLLSSAFDYYCSADYFAVILRRHMLLSQICDSNEGTVFGQVLTALQCRGSVYLPASID